MSVTRLPLRRYFSVPRLKRRRAEFALLIALAVVLELAAGIGLASVAGFSPVRAALGGFDWVWLAALAGALMGSFVGYFYAYRGIHRVEGGPALSGRQMHAKKYTWRVPLADPGWTRRMPLP